MFKTNYHSHSDFCDGTGKLEEYVKSAISKGFDVFGFSGHAPLPFESDWTMSDSNLQKYIKKIIQLKSMYNGKIEIKSGLEIDYIENLMSPADSIYNKLKLDYSIGSVHMLKDLTTGKFLSIDLSTNETKRLIDNSFNGNAKLLVQEYYKNIRKMSLKGGMDIIGHLDVIKKTNINSIFFDETQNWYKDEIEKTLKQISLSEQIVEINTGKIIRDPSKIYPSPWILKMAKKYNIPVMLNSDSHRPDRIDNYYDEAKTIIINAGYSELMVLTGNKWVSDIIVQS